MNRKRNIAFNFFNSQNYPSPEIKDLLFDLSILNSYGNIQAYFEKNKIPFEKRELDRFIASLEATLFNQVERLSFIKYQYGTLSHDWGALTEEQHRLTLCRNLLNIPYDVEITYDHLQSFQDLFNRRFSEMGLFHLSMKGLEHEINEFKFKLLDKIFYDLPDDKINQILRFLGSKKVLFVDFQGKGISAIFGTARLTTYRDYYLYFISSEDIICSEYIMANVAANTRKTIIVREEALWGIVFHKWLVSTQYNDFVSSRVLSNPAWMISQAIKEKAMGYYSQIDFDALLENKETLFKDIRETIGFHELGHAVINNEVMTIENAGIGRAGAYFSEDIFEALIEFFADFSPKFGKLLGPLKNMVEVAKKDNNRGERLFYLYLSDVWFYDTEDTYMYLYSDLICLVLLRYIKDDQHIDFEQLDQDLAYSTSNSGKGSIFERLLEMYNQEAQEIKSICEKAILTYGGRQYTFQQIYRIWFDEMKKKFPFYSLERYENISAHWLNMVAFVHKDSNSSEKLERFMTQSKSRILKKVMILSSGRKKADAYQYEHRRYIIDRMTELGFTSSILYS